MDCCFPGLRRGRIKKPRIAGFFYAPLHSIARQQALVSLLPVMARSAQFVGQQLQDAFGIARSFRLTIGILHTHHAGAALFRQSDAIA